jgi:hypothetical protein
MVVALDFERDRLARAEVDDAGVLARPLQDARALGRKAGEQRGRMLVGAMLRPEEREDAELEVVRLATEQDPDSFELLVREAERAVKRLFRDRAQRPESNDRRGRL